MRLHAENVWKSLELQREQQQSSGQQATVQNVTIQHQKDSTHGITKDTKNAELEEELKLKQQYIEELLQKVTNYM